MVETMELKEKYETRKEAEKRGREERAPKPLWWLGQRDPGARFTAWLAIFTALLFIELSGVPLLYCALTGLFTKL